MASIQTVPPDEAARLEALRRYDILDTAPEEAFDRLTRLGAHLLGVPIMLISLIDRDRQWFKSVIGLGITETPRSQAFCAHAILDRQLVVVEDACDDPRFAANPLVVGPPRIRFYAAAPLLTPDGFALGSLCAIDRQPRRLGDDQRRALQDLAALVSDQMELRRTARALTLELAERQAAEEARRRVEARLSTAVESLPFHFWITDGQGRCVLQNSLDRQAWGDAIGKRLDEMAGDEANRARWQEINRRAMAGETVRTEATYVTAAGTIDVDEIVAPVRLGEQVIGLVGVNIDQTEHHRVEAAYRDARKRLEALTNSGVVGIAYGEGRRLVEVNECFAGMVGRSRRDILAGSVADWRALTAPGWAHVDRRAARHMLTLGRAGPYEKEYLRVDGVLVPALIVSAIVERQPLRWIALVQDISARKAAEARIRELADTDALTGLANRRAFMRLLEATLAAHQLGGEAGAVLLLDLDNFKEINDGHGHDAGDAVLAEVSRRLCHRLRPTDLAARLGGDEFAILLRGVTDEGDAQRVGCGLIAALADPVDHGGGEIRVRASIGATLYPRHGVVAMELLKNADIALYEAKGRGRNLVALFDPVLRRRIDQRRRLADDLRDGLARGELELVYQPQIVLSDGRHDGFEALLRWRRGDSLVAPAVFLPVAEETGLIVAIGRLALRLALTAMRGWIDLGLEPGIMSVNVAAAQLRGRGFADEVAGLLDELRLDVDRLKIEITENVLLDRGAEEVGATLHRLDELGVTIALDDFGTGYASLSHLKRLPVDRLKIDPSFVRDLATDPDDAAIARSIINLAHTLDMRVVAEGIETEEQLAFLRANGCDLGQGYLFAPGLSPPDASSYLDGDRGGNGALAANVLVGV